MTADLVSANLQSNETYTVFDSGLVWEGSVTVVKKLGWCLVHGSVTLTGYRIRHDQHPGQRQGARPPDRCGNLHHGGVLDQQLHPAHAGGRGRRGSLRIMYGDAGTFPFSIAYPIA